MNPAKENIKNMEKILVDLYDNILIKIVFWGISGCAILGIFMSLKIMIKKGW